MKLKMKELESRTGVSREAIRFYIREGLLPEPQKPKRNVALYSDEHVARIKLIKQLQDEHFLPLKEVKTFLDSKALGSRFNDLSLFLPALMRDLKPRPDSTLAAAAESSGLPVEEIRELHEQDILTIKEGDKLSYRDVALIESWGAARRRGFSPDHGYRTEFLARYARIAKELADLEVDQFFEEFAESLDGEDGAALGADGIEFANTLLTLLHTRFLLRAITEKSR